MSLHAFLPGGAAEARWSAIKARPPIERLRMLKRDALCRWIY